MAFTQVGAAHWVLGSHVAETSGNVYRSASVPSSGAVDLRVEHRQERSAS
jgi:hypothetical protein